MSRRVRAPCSYELRVVGAQYLSYSSTLQWLLIPFGVILIGAGQAGVLVAKEIAARAGASARSCAARCSASGRGA